jgi:pyrroloquinoline quinone biosynthesis protein B
VRAIVLGSAAGGGVPQWNCVCPVCRLAWAGDVRVKPRTQSSLAVSADDRRWVIVNASPDIRQQIAATPILQPSGQGSSRQSPVAAVVLTNGDIDHVGGLLSLRESQPFALFAAQATHKALDGNAMFGVLNRALVKREVVALDAIFEPLPGIEAELFAVPGKVPLWLEDDQLRVGELTESTVGISLSANGRRVVYVPGCAYVTDAVMGRLAGADVVLFDGTLWNDDEMIALGLGQKTGRRMGHMPMAGIDGTLDVLQSLPAGRRVFIHINNTNAALIEDSPQRRAAEQAGWEIGYDGMEFNL